MPKFHNHLIHEKSPYLLQHAHNPVRWYPWNGDAFDKATREDKPIFLSIGYSTCHWCHVMEQESFEDKEVAALMNEAFVAIKVDREERPDIDNVYMTVCQMLTGSGGWPLTIIMTPDKKPFFAATYIPKQSRFGRMGMLELIPKIRQIWQHERERVFQSAHEITEKLQSTTDTAAGVSLKPALLERTFTDLSRRFDAEKGGFNDAPKFPTPHNLLFLLRYYARNKNDLALQMVEKTLLEMRRGGIFDHIGFGFHRYSTDQQWLLPHFEKMLYDQAMLILAYSEAYQLTRKEEYAQTAREIITYVLRDMNSPNGGFYSAEDADSDGEEGTFYVWTKSDIEKYLGDDAAWFCDLYQIKNNGNFVEEATQQKTGSNIVYRTESVADYAERSGMDVDELTTKIKTARQRLFDMRKQRVHPYKDDKILTDWNGLMIAALATAGRILGETHYITAAETATAFVKKNLQQTDGSLLHRYRDVEAAIPAFTDDYAFLIWGLIELHQTTQDTRYLSDAIDLQQIHIERYWEKENGGFFTTAHDGESLLIRDKEVYDGAIPSGNSVALYNLVRLARLTGDAHFDELAEQLGQAFSASISQQPSAYTFFMSAFDFANGPAFEIVVVGPKSEKTEIIFNTLNTIYVPAKVVLYKENDQAQINTLSKFVADYKALDGEPTIFICREFACHQPTTDVNEMQRVLWEDQ